MYSISDSSKTLQNITNTCKYEIDYTLQSSLPMLPLNTKTYGFNTDNINKKSYSKIPNAIEESFNITHYHHKDDHNENNSINTNTRLNLYNLWNDLLLKKVIDIFDYNINNFLLSIMTKASYSPNKITDQSMEYLTVMVSTVKTQTKRTK